VRYQILILGLFMSASITSATLRPDRERLGLKGAVKEVHRLNKEDSSGGGAKGSREKATHTYDFDRAGFLSGEIFFDDGFEFQICSISYDPSGSRIGSVVEKDTSSLSSVPRGRSGVGSSSEHRASPSVFKDVFKLDSNGRVAEETQYGGDGQRVRTQRLSYDAEGHVASMVWVAESGEEYGGQQYTYYPTGEAKELVAYGEIEARYADYKFDKIGNWIERTHEAVDFRLQRPEGGQRPLSHRSKDLQVIVYY
jgi:hypothetical protein